MIEDAMMFALGLACAVLVVLAVMPFLWARALRVSHRRLDSAVPASLGEVLAQRDGFRAQAAVAAVALEQKVDRARSAVAGHAADLGRRTSELVLARREVDQLSSERAALAGDLDRCRTALAGAEDRGRVLEVERAALQGRLAEADDVRRGLERDRDAQGRLADERRHRIAALDGTVQDRDASLAALRGDIERDREEAARLRATIADHVKERDGARSEVAMLTTERRVLQDQVREGARRADETGARLLARSEALNEAERRIMEQDGELRVSAAALAELRGRFAALEARLIERVGAEPGRSVSEAELAGLRAAIAAVGDDAIRLLRPEGMADPALGETDESGRIEVAPVKPTPVRSADALF